MNPCIDKPSMPISYGSERWAFICGCDWRTPTLSDKRTTQQALEAHQSEQLNLTPERTAP